MQTDSSISSFQFSLYKENKNEGDDVVLQPVIAVEVTGGMTKALAVLFMDEYEKYAKH